MYDQLTAGNTAVFIDKDLLGEDGSPTWQLFLQDVGKNYIAPDGLETLRKLECMFANRIGIPANLATAKKERLISAEVSANDAETYTTASLWLDELQKSCETANQLFGLDLSVDWRVNPMEGGVDNANASINPGTVER